MNIMNEQVRHQQFGIGTVVGQTATTVAVEFSKEYGTKKFLYPSVFESFLALCDPASKIKMEDELRQIHEQAEAEQKMKMEEDEKRREEERRSLFEQKRSAARIRSAARKTPKKSKKKQENMDLAEKESEE